MRRRIELRETVIAPGAIVRLKKEYAPSLKDLMARWRVLEIVETERVLKAEDIEDNEDRRWFSMLDIERVSGGVEGVVGHAWVDEESGSTQTEDESYVDDPYDDAESEIEIPSLFDDPIALQLEEDKDDPDYEDE